MQVNELIKFLQDKYKGNETLLVQWFDADDAGIPEEQFVEVVSSLESSSFFDNVSEMFREEVEYKTAQFDDDD